MACMTLGPYLHFELQRTYRAILEAIKLHRDITCFWRPDFFRFYQPREDYLGRDYTNTDRKRHVQHLRTYGSFHGGLGRTARTLAGLGRTRGRRVEPLPFRHSRVWHHSTRNDPQMLNNIVAHTQPSFTQASSTPFSVSIDLASLPLNVQSPAAVCWSREQKMPYYL